MKSNEIAYLKWTSWAGPVALLAAAGAAGLWSWQAHSEYVLLRGAVGVVALTALFSAVWLYRIRTARRHFAALDAYAEQELERAEHRSPTSARKSDRHFSSSSV